MVLEAPKEERAGMRMRSFESRIPTAQMKFLVMRPAPLVTLTSDRRRSAAALFCSISGSV